MEGVAAGQEKDSATPEEKSDIVKCGEEAQVQALADLLLNLRLIVNKPAFSDVVFLCGDGKRVHASRILLASRSEVLKSMLMNGMAESSLPEIKMTEVSSLVLLAVFEFLYTGTLLDYQPAGWSIACELILASRFFLLPNLEMITRKFMHSLTLVVVEDLPKAASMLTEAVAMKAFREEDVNLEELVTILSSDWSNSEYIRNLSEDAFYYLLESSWADFEDDGKLVFTEYLRFRQVVRWWVYQTGSGSRSLEELLTVVAPDVEEALSICRNSDAYVKGKCTPDDWRENEAAHESAIRLMENIDLRWIHPALLAKVVEPLKVVSSEEILSCFQFHALRRPMVFKSQYCWEHGELYSKLEPGYVLQKIKNGVGLAVMIATMSRSYGVHHWSFFIEEICIEFVEVGFICYTNEKPQCDGERLSDQRHARVLKFEGDEVSIGKKEVGGLIDWKALRNASTQLNTPIVFSYNAFEHSCSLSINGKDFGKCWKHLPSVVYYPAVCLGTGSDGRVRFELVSGFDMV